MSEDAKPQSEEPKTGGRTAPKDPAATAGSDGASGPLSGSGTGSDPLEELRNLVMSIEWEITDDVMLRFVDQIEFLKSTYGKDRILVMFLQLLGSLGLYVRTYKARAHPNAFKLLQSVYAGFDKVMTSPDYSPSEKKKLLYVELNKYKELKEQIDESKAVSAPRPDAGAQEPFPRSPVDEPDRGGDKAEGAKARGPATEKKPGPEKEPPGADVLQAIEQLAAAMEARFDQLASEIKSLKKRL